MCCHLNPHWFHNTWNYVSMLEYCASGAPLDFTYSLYWRIIGELHQTGVTVRYRKELPMAPSRQWMPMDLDAHGHSIEI